VDEETRLRHEAWHAKWGYYDAESDALAYVCRRCGTAVGPYATDTHDQFHAQIDALTEERK
jgi:hypothetical protein